MPTYCCVQDWEGGEENIVADPLFVDADGPDDDPDTWEDNDYHLSSDSPCIDAGLNDDWMLDAFDLDGNPRICDDTVDMGAYEYSGPAVVLRIDRIELVDGEIEIGWVDAGKGIGYILEWAHSLEAPVWTILTETTDLCARDANIAGINQRFYRLQIAE